MSYAESAASAKRRIIIDLRCLQDLTNAERGIPGHARNALLQARMVSELARDAWLIGLIDPALPALPDEIAGAVNELRTNGYFPAAKAGTIFVQPAPMGADQVFVARLLLDQNIRSVAMVYDFIPFDEPEQFAGSVPQRLDYVTALAWLKHYDMFLPISQDTQTRLRTMYPQTTRSFVTGVPIAPWLEADDKPRLAPRHILAVAGNNLRKNPEVLIRAHAASKVLQSRKIPLVICGNYAPFHREKFLALAAEHGGGKALLQIPGRLPDAALRAQYQQAICVVTPSRAEGFSMPVIEAMACATPSIVSDIPVHEALVPDSTLRFGPDDDAALAAILERIVTEPGHRDEIIAAQAKIWPQFRASEVARKIWRQIEALAQPELPRIHIGGRRPRIAMLTPLPPAQTGVANYTASTAKALAKIADVSLFSASPESHAAPLSGLAHLSRRFDRVISVIGNSPYHERIYDLALRHGSACICHDARMLFFMVAKFGAAKTASMASAELQRPVSEAEILAWQADEGLREASFFGDLAQAARPLIFHNRSSVALVQHRFNTTAAYLPFAVFLPFQTGQISAAAQQRAREKLGLDRTEILICSFGFIDPSKGIAPALQAMALLKSAGIKCRLIWVGAQLPDMREFEMLRANLGLRSEVQFNRDYLSSETYRDYLLAANCGLQLRMNGTGNISGALQDCITAGLPTVANEDLAENVNAPGFIRRVDNRLDPQEIADALRELIETGASRDAHEAARAAHCETYGMANYVSSLCEILELDL